MTPFYGPDLAQLHNAHYGAIGAAAAHTLLRALGKPGPARGTLVDLGCGAGASSAVLAAHGHAVFGVDVSPSMVALAREAVPSGMFVCAPLIDIALPVCAGVLAAGEVLNYAVDARDPLESLRALASHVFGALTARGVFLFDVVTPGSESPPARQVFVEQGDTALMLRVEEDVARMRVDRRMTLFRKEPDGRYRRSDEHHVQRLFDPSAVRALLEQAGFEVRELRAYEETKLRAGVVAFCAQRPE